MLTSPRRLLAALGCSLALGAAAPAQAGIIVGTYDPAFGNGFTGLGWMGQVRLDVPDTCLALSAATLTSAECQGTRILGGYVKLYDLSDPSKYDLLDFMSSTLRLGLMDIRISDGSFAGLYTNLEFNAQGTWQSTFSEHWASPAGTLGGQVDPRYANYRYGLFFDGDQAFLRASAISIDFSQAAPVDPSFGCPWDGDYAICSSATAPSVVFTRLEEPPTDVPEPAGLLLLGSALAAAGWVRRRRAGAR